jgi:hypothetical protein
MAGENGALWKVVTSAADGLEATASAASVNNVLLFNPTSKVIGEGAGFLSDINVQFRRATPENEAVNNSEIEIQDMGVDSLDITLTVLCGNTDNDDPSNPINKLSLWLQTGNTTTGYTKGRYGLRLDNAPQWNVVPTATYGFHIRDVDFTYIGEKTDQCLAVIHLSLGGAIINAI